MTRERKNGSNEVTNERINQPFTEENVQLITNESVYIAKVNKDITSEQCDSIEIPVLVKSTRKKHSSSIHKHLNLVCITTILLRPFSTLLLPSSPPRHHPTEPMHSSPHRSIHEQNRPPNKPRNSSKPLIRTQPHHNRPRPRQRRNQDTNGPLDAINRDDAEGCLADKCDQDLASHHETVDDNEEVVPVQAREDIEFVVKPSVVKFVEDLHPYKCVEDDGATLRVWVVEESWAFGKVQD